MWYIAAVAGIVVAGTLAGVIRSKGIDTLKEAPAASLINSASIKSLTIDQVGFLLARLEREEPPQPVFGAMCYEMMAPPMVAEYICPVCGEKTLYEDYRTEFIEWELQGARRLAESIDEATEFSITLDETLFCDYCSEGSHQDPALLLRVVPEEGEEVVSTVSLIELRMLDSFLQGRLYYLTDNDSQEPLQDHADRLREIMGL